MRWSPLRIRSVSGTDGSLIRMLWNRRSRALSFSMCFLYSSRVEAPMQRSWPRARAPLSMLEASSPPSTLPAPTTVWMSSMNRITWPEAASTSSLMVFRRSSNSPRNFEPDTTSLISSMRTLFPIRVSGTSALAIRWARPSTITVLPTPGSPMSTGLFFFRRSRIWMSRRISSSRPTTGSRAPRRAISVRSVVYLVSVSNLVSPRLSSTVRVPRWRR